MFSTRSFLAAILSVICFISFFSSQSMAAGALAIDKNQGAKYGWAIDYPTFEQAENEALKKCGSGCSIVFTFSGGAAAYAADQSAGSTIFGWGRAASADSAKQIALQEVQNRGGKTPIIRAWGQESKKDKTSSNSKVKVFVALRLWLDNGDDTGVATGGWAKFVGWTYATKDELLQYGRNRWYVTYSDDVTGLRKDGSYLTTNTMGGTPDSSPIMKRFVSNVVHKHALYSKRKVSEYYNDVMVKYSHDNKFKYFAYDGSMITLDENWTYKQLKDAATYYENNHDGYLIVDAGEF